MLNEAYIEQQVYLKSMGDDFSWEAEEPSDSKIEHRHLRTFPTKLHRSCTIS